MEQNRICRVCGTLKSLSEFYPNYGKSNGKRQICKQCFLAQNKKYHLEHREDRLAYSKEYYRKNKEKFREFSRIRKKERLITDAIYRTKRHARLSIWKAFNKQGRISLEKTKYWVGCSPEELTTHLKQTWKQKYGEDWRGQPCNVDHIIPLITAKTSEEVRQLCHYTNLRLITPEDNMIKGLKERRENNKGGKK